MASLAGKVVYYGWHRPLAAARESFRAGGPLEQWRTARGHAAMARAAATLPLPPSASTLPIELHVLTGRRFWDQTAFCLWTLAQYAGRPLAPVLYDDGSLDESHRAPLGRLFPAARFVARAEIVDRLEALLPLSRFPFLRDRWQHYPNIRKLTDPHLGARGWKLVLDSDLLFFRRPTMLVEWVVSPQCPLHATDCETSYGYPRAALDALAGAPLADLINVGVCGLKSEELDWEKIEHWCASLIRRHGTHYYLEQALVAMLLAGRDCAVLPGADYVTYPRPPEVDACRAVMHHYVAGSKPWYFRHNWRRAIAAATQTPSVT